MDNFKKNFKGKKAVSKKIGIAEPVRQSLYDILIENLKEAQRKTFIHRLIYTGRHDFEKQEEWATTYFRRSVEKVNELGSIEPLSGFYLHYPKLFVHFVEGDEDAICRHLRFLLGSKSFSSLSDVKVMVHLSHISEKLTTDWTYYSGIPKQLLNPPKHTENDTPEDTARQIFKCVNMLNQLVIRIIQKDEEPEEAVCSYVSEIETSSRVNMRSSYVRMSTSTISSSNLFTSKQRLYGDTLPEYDVLDYVITSPYVTDLKEYFNLWGNIKQFQLDKDKVWPIDTDFICYDVFDSDYTRNVDMFKSSEEDKGEDNLEKEADLE